MIPVVIIALLTFPGVVVHELAHALCCRWTGVAIHKICLFRFGNPAGYVLHAETDHPAQAILISTGPLFVNTLLGALLGCVALHATILFPDHITLAHALSWWLGISIAAHAFPSTSDARSLWARLWKRGTPWGIRLLGVPIVAINYLFALGSVVWLDVLYGVAVAVWVPRLLQAWRML